jgi:S1-C subfamily serine protease
VPYAPQLPPPLPGMPPLPPSTPAPPRRRPVALGATVGAVALLAAAGGALLGARLDDDPPSAARPSSGTVVTSPPLQVSDDGGGLAATAIDVPAAVAAVEPSIVAVSADVEEAGASGHAVGTGVVLTADGEILTNAHVVAGASAVRVRLFGEIEPRDATVLAADAANDLALLKVDATDLPPAVFAEPSTIAVGDEVIAVGYALDLDGDPTVSKGIISAVDRTMITDLGALDGLLQTDAAISSGNSGGPLVNARGEVVGINTAVYRGDATTAVNNVGFAIGAARVLPRVDDLRAQAGGAPQTEGYLGVSLEQRTDGGQGALITSVAEDSPAADAGMQVGDVVLEVDGSPITGSGGLIAAIRSTAPGTRLDITVSRDGQPIDMTATIVERES